MEKVLDYIHRTLAPSDGGLTDGQLLSRFIASRDERSFALLVRRHGPMVWRLCRRVLGHVQDAEDTFQATFLVLARRAASVVKRESVGSFLYGVAYRTALDAKAINARRRSREKQVADVPHPEVMPAGERDWRHWLDLELSRLPEKYRTTVILCDLEGRSRKEAARQLKVPEGTLSSRLAMARKMLALRLTRRGVALSGGVLSATLSEVSATTIPARLVAATVKVAVLVAAGEFSAVSSSVGILMKGAFQTMLLAKLKLVVGAVMVVMALGASGLVFRAAGQSAPGPKRPLSELEALRRENELLKLNLEVVLEKVRAQEAELRALRADARKAEGAENAQRESAAKALLQLAQEAERQATAKAALDAMLMKREADLKSYRGVLLQGRLVPGKSDPLQEAEAALKTLREARDTEAQRKAADALEKALQRLREQQKTQEGPPK